MWWDISPGCFISLLTISVSPQSLCPFQAEKSFHPIIGPGFRRMPKIFKVASWKNVRNSISLALVFVKFQVNGARDVVSRDAFFVFEECAKSKFIAMQN